MKVTINNPVIARYVQALYSIANEQSCEHDVERGLSEICKLIENSKNYKRMLSRFSLTPSDAIKFVDMLEQSANVNGVVLNFLKLLAHNKRFSLLSEISKSYSDYLKDIEGTKTVFVTYAKEFSEKDKVDLLDNLKEVFECDNVECVLRKDATLIDGIQIQYNSKMLDYSVKSKLARLHKAIRRDSYAD